MKLLSKGTVPLSMAAAAALLSMLIGFLSGVDPFQIMIRGLIAACLAGGFVFLADWLIKTFLPELNHMNSSESEQSIPAAGSQVNIVMPDEMPETLQTAETASQSGSEGPEDSSDEASLESLDENLSENEIAESIESVHNNKPEEPDTVAAAVESLDSLPNLDSLEISIGSTAGSGDDMDTTKNLDSVTPPPARGGADIDLGENNDPEIIAKAVKTVLAKDQQK